MLNKLTDEIINGRRLNRYDSLNFFESCNLSELTDCADKIKEAFCKNKINLCTIINGRSGKCSENCKFCAQSSHYKTETNEHSFLSPEDILKDCRANEKEGVHRYSIVTAGKRLEGEDLKLALKAYQLIKSKCSVKICASHGLLTDEAFTLLKENGVTRYHANIETSRRFFKSICSTHTFEDKISCIKAAQRAGLSVCSGGIIGMGETFADRIDMALCLSELNIDSIPINVLIPIKGTAFENLLPISQDEILRTIAMFRFINPTADIRLAAGRSVFKDHGARAFKSGANSAITGNMLTTTGCNTKSDIKMLTEMGFDLNT